jgi:hypothetical protein
MGLYEGFPGRASSLFLKTFFGASLCFKKILLPVGRLFLSVALSVGVQKVGEIRNDGAWCMVHGVPLFSALDPRRLVATGGAAQCYR